MKVFINANYQGTERKEVEGTIVRRTASTVWVTIRDIVAEKLRAYDSISAGQDAVPSTEPLYRTIKRKIPRDVPSLVERDGDAAQGA